MSDSGEKGREQDWDPRAREVCEDQLAYYDAMRERCPVAYSDFLGWSLFRHEDLVRVLDDHETFSSVVSRHLSVPNGMDPPEHTAYRAVVEPYFAPQRMAAFAPVCRSIVVELLEEALTHSEGDWVADVAQPFAVRVQCAFLGWPAEFHEPLVRWTKKNHRATFAQDRHALTRLAAEFEGLVKEMIGERRLTGATPNQDVTAALLHEEVNGRRLNHAELASLLRNWTVGEVGTIAASVSILLHELATSSDLQAQLRDRPERLPIAIDEILRLHGPLVANRRVTTCPVEIGGRTIPAGERLSLIWPSANRDPQVFEDPEEFRWERNHSDNLLYGAGIHVCPGAPLARMELQVLMEEILQRTTSLQLAPNTSPKKAVYPASGFASLSLLVQR